MNKRSRRRKTDVADVSVSESDADSMTLPETEAPRVVPVTPAQHVLPISTEGRSLSKALLRLDLRLLGKDTVVRSSPSFFVANGQAWRQMFLLGVILLTGIFLWNNRQSAPSIYIPTLPPIPSFSISSPSPSAPTPSGASPSIDPALANDLKRRLDAVEKELRSLSDRSASSTSDSQKGLQKLRDDLSATQKRVDDSAASLKELSAQAGKDGPVARDLASLSKESVTLAAQHKELAAQYGALAKEQATLGAANKDLAAQQRDLAAQQREVAAQQARLREELAGMVKDVSERLKSESAARAELAAELQRYKAAAPAAKEEAEEKLRTRVKALVAELLPAQAPAAPASTHSAPSPAPVVREFKLAEHRAALEALIQEVLKRDSPDFATSLAAQKGNVQMWAQDAVGPDIRRLDARDRELADKLTSTAAAVAAVQASAAAAPTAAPATSASGGASEARVAELIDAALEQYAADRLAVPDYALESAGASIVRWRTSPSYRSGSWLAVPRPLGPSVALQPDVHVGRCFAFAGSQGNITVHLAAAVAPTAVSIEHVSSRIAHDVDSAPRDFAVWGMKHETDEGEQMVKLGQFTYDTKDKHALQTFPIKAATDAPAFPLVMLQVLSNHGHDAFTCIYRFRVHGKEADA